MSTATQTTQRCITASRRRGQYDLHDKEAPKDMTRAGAEVSGEQKRLAGGTISEQFDLDHDY